VLITSGYMTDAILHWWSRLPQGEAGRGEGQALAARVCV
jgi:hypothetical protein